MKKQFYQIGNMYYYYNRKQMYSVDIETEKYPIITKETINYSFDWKSHEITKQEFVNKTGLLKIKQN